MFFKKLMNRTKLLQLLLALIFIFFITGCSYNIEEVNQLSNDVSNNTYVNENNLSLENDNNSFRIAYVGYSKEQPFWNSLGSFIEKEAKSKNLSYIDLTPLKLNSEEYHSSLELAIDSQVNGIIIGAGSDPSSIYDLLDLILEKNIFVVAVDTKINHPAINSFIATDNFQGAKIAGNYIYEKTNGTGSVLILGGTKNHPNGDARKNGVSEVVIENGMDVIYKQSDWEVEKAFIHTQEELNKENDISAIFSCWDPGLISSYQVVKDKNMTDILMVGFDGLTENLIQIKNGNLDATIAQPIELMGRESVSLMIKILNNEKYDSELLIPGILVTKDNVDDFLK
jgi:ribose transport system substrate-binding protein